MKKWKKQKRQKIAWKQTEEPQFNSRNKNTKKIVNKSIFYVIDKASSYECKNDTLNYMQALLKKNVACEDSNLLLPHFCSAFAKPDESSTLSGTTQVGSPFMRTMQHNTKAKLSSDSEC